MEEARRTGEQEDEEEQNTEKEENTCLNLATTPEGVVNDARNQARVVLYLLTNFGFNM